MTKLFVEQPLAWPGSANYLFSVNISYHAEDSTAKMMIKFWQKGHVCYCLVGIQYIAGSHIPI